MPPDRTNQRIRRSVSSPRRIEPCVRFSAHGSPTPSPPVRYAARLRYLVGVDDGLPACVAGAINDGGPQRYVTRARRVDERGNPTGRGLGEGQLLPGRAVIGGGFDRDGSDIGGGAAGIPLDP